MDTSNTTEAQSAPPSGAAETVISASAAGARSADPAVDMPKLELPKAATLDVASLSVPSNIEQLRIEPLPLDDLKAPRAIRAEPAPGEAVKVAAAAASTGAVPRARVNRLNPVAAAVALAAAFGVLAGALGVAVLARPAPDATGTTPAAVPQDIHAALEQMRTDLAALRSGVEAGTRNVNAQFGKVTERFDRVERAQTERAAKLAKAVEAIERLERRADAAPAKETTGSVTPPPAAAAAAPAVAPVHPQQSIIPGWTVRDVYRGVAIIQGARTGPMEIEAGDTVPYLGRIEAIRRQDGHWIVVTSKGVITSMR